MTPLVSAIMPTRERPEWAQRAVECWRSQDYPNKELVILDDLDSPSFPDGISGKGIEYHAQTSELKMTVAEKLNRLCELANGDILIRFDDDDYSAPGRIADQVDRLLTSKLGVTGYHSMLFVDASGLIRKYEGLKVRGYGAGPDYALGTSLCFTRAFWEQNRFHEDKRTRPDNNFVRAARNAQQILNVDAGPLMFARVHDHNTSPKRMDRYSSVNIAELEMVPQW